MIRRALAAAAAAALLAACGGGDEQGRFDDEVETIRSAIEAGDREAALNGLDGIAISALGAHEEGELSDAEVEEVAALIAHGRALVDEQIPPGATEPAPTTTTAAPTTTTPSPAVATADEDGDDDEDDEGRGRGAGKGKKDDDD